jgi:hypothetical protein
MSSVIGTFVTLLRPDRAFSDTPVNMLKELFKNQYVDRPLGLSRGPELLRSLHCSLINQYWSLPSVTELSPQYS